MKMRRILLLLVLLLAAPAHAYDASGALPDAAQEEKARALFRELRCMVCQNQSIDDSDAPLAKDLRALVRERVAAGDSEETIKTFLVERYGDFVLLKPRFSAANLLLWGAPVLAFAVGGAIVVSSLRRRKKLADGRPLTDDEKRRLDTLLGD